MPESIFNENMSSREARQVLFSSVDGKTKAEIEKIKDEYSAVLPVIMDRELKLADQGWMID